VTPPSAKDSVTSPSAPPIYDACHPILASLRVPTSRPPLSSLIVLALLTLLRITSTGRSTIKTKALDNINVEAKPPRNSSGLFSVMRTSGRHRHSARPGAAGAVTRSRTCGSGWIRPSRSGAKRTASLLPCCLIGERRRKSRAQHHSAPVSGAFSWTARVVERRIPAVRRAFKRFGRVA
jgi:hypothetical protein